MSAMERSGEMLDDVSEAAQETAEDIQGDLSRATGTMRSRARSFKNSAVARAKELGAATENKIHELRLRAYLASHPIEAVACSIAVGVAIGWLLGRKND